MIKSGPVDAYGIEICDIRIVTIRVCRITRVSLLKTTCQSISHFRSFSGRPPNSL